MQFQYKDAFLLNYFCHITVVQLTRDFPFLVTSVSFYKASVCAGLSAGRRKLHLKTRKQLETLTDGANTRDLSLVNTLFKIFCSCTSPRYCKCLQLQFFEERGLTSQIPLAYCQLANCSCQSKNTKKLTASVGCKVQKCLKLTPHKVTIQPRPTSLPVKHQLQVYIPLWRWLKNFVQTFVLKRLRQQQTPR